MADDLPDDPPRNDEGGEAPDAARLAALVYDELRELAARQLAGERREHTLQATALVHEAYLRLHRERRSNWRSDTHFLAVASQAMRRVLVDHARGRRAAKRGGAALRVTLHDVAGDANAPSCDALDVIDLDSALDELRELDPRAAEVVALRYFAGLDLDEVAAAIGVSRRTAAEDWAIARSWLRRRLAGDDG